MKLDRAAGLVPLTAALAALLAFPPVEAQEERPAPLSDADVIRLLAGSTYEPAEVEAIVRRSCLDFRPDDDDFANYRLLGASEDVMEAIRSCARVPRTAARTTPAPGPVSLHLSSTNLSLTAGDTVTIGVAARRGGAPVAGARLVLEGSGSIGERSASDLTASTDSAGNARFDIPAGSRVASYSLRVVRAGSPSVTSAPVRLSVSPAAPTRIAVRTAGHAAGPGGGQESVVAEVTDRFGNPVPAAPLVVRVGDSEGGSVVGEATTDQRGRARIELSATADELEGVALLGVWSGRRRVGSMPAAVATGPVEPPPGEPEGRHAAVARGSSEPAALRDSAASALEEEGVAAAIATLRRAADAAPSDAATWEDLGRAWREAGRTEEARWSWLRARRHASGERRSRVDSLLSSLRGLPGGLRLEAWGGHTLDVDGAGGLRWAEVELRVAPKVELYGRYDESVAPSFPALIRGPERMRHFAGGATVDWGEGGRLYTTAEVGRRQQVVGEFVENLYRLEQGVRIETDRGFARMYGGGLVGLWPRRDEWVAYAGAGLPVSLSAELRPELYVGETVGTELAGSRRQPAREVRGRIGLALRPGGGWRVVPAVGLGNVSAERDDRSGRMWEVEVAASARITGPLRTDLFARHQAVPGGEAVTVVAAGLSLGVR